MCKLLLVTLTFLSLKLYAQKQYVIPAAKEAPYSKGSVLIESNLLPVQKSDTFTISPFVEFGRKKNYLIKGLLKSLSAGVLAYKLNKKNSHINLKEKSLNKGLGLSLGVGITAGTPDYIKAFTHKKAPQVIYSLFNKNKILISRELMQWNSKSRPIKAIATQDGFLQVSFINGNKKVALVADMEIKIKPKDKDKDKGVASNSYTNPDDPPAEDVVAEVTVDGIDISFYDRNNNGQIDGYSYSVGGDVVVGNVAEYGVYYDYNIPAVAEDFNPPQWNDMGEYLNWYNYYYYDGAPPAPSGDPIQNNIIDPCINSKVTAIMNAATSIAIMQQMNSAFNSTSNYHVSLNQVMSIDNDASGVTQQPVDIGDGIKLIAIQFSRTVLDGASQQFTATTVLHEMTHAYLLTQPNMPTDITGQHEYMLQNYTTTIADGLQTLFPSMDRTTALGLALGGYGGIQSSNPTLWNSVLSQLGLTDQQVTSINSYHRVALAGNPCQ